MPFSGRGRRKDGIRVAERLGALWASGKAQIWQVFWEEWPEKLVGPGTDRWWDKPAGMTGFLHIEEGRSRQEQRLGVGRPASLQKPVCVERMGKALEGRWAEVGREGHGLGSEQVGVHGGGRGLGTWW